MTPSPTSRRLRWLAPAAVAAAVAAAALTSNVASAAGETPKLPARTAAELLAAVQSADPAGMSGTIVETAKLGLPDLSAGTQETGSATLSLQSLLTGSHTVRFWYAGEARQRIAVLGELSESNIVHNGTDLWTYTSSTQRVTHSKIKQPDNVRGSAQSALGASPQVLAETLLAAIEPTTTVTVDSTARVADRAAYQLLVKPRDERSLIGSIRLAIDSKTNVPLRVQVFAKAATKPAIEVGFTDVSFKVPDASVFTFVPPAGTTVIEEPLGATMLGSGEGRYGRRSDMPRRMAEYGTGLPGAAAAAGRAEGVQVLGSGWTAVAVVPAREALGQYGTMLNRAAEPVEGGRLITSALLSVFISDNGNVYVGPVAGSELQKVAATGRGL